MRTRRSLPRIGRVAYRGAMSAYPAEAFADVVGWRVREQAHGVLRADRAAWEREQAG